MKLVMKILIACLSLFIFTTLKAETLVDADMAHTLLSSDDTLRVKSLNPSDMISEEYCEDGNVDEGCLLGLNYQVITAYINSILGNYQHLNFTLGDNCSNGLVCTVNITHSSPNIVPKHKEVSHTYNISFVGVRDEAKEAKAKKVLNNLKQTYRLMDMSYISEIVNYQMDSMEALIRNVHVLKTYGSIKKEIETNKDVQLMVGFNGAGSGGYLSGNNGGLFAGVDGTFYGVVKTAFYIDQIIVIPQSVENTDEKNIEAVKNKIDNYINNEKITTSITKTEENSWLMEEDMVSDIRETLKYYFNDTEVLIRGAYLMNLDLNLSDGMGVAYQSDIIVISVPDDIYNDLNTIINSYDSDTDISISTKANNVPLDTTIESEDVTKSEYVQNALKTNKSILIAAYNINLYSIINNTYIKKIDNGVEVIVPISPDYADSTIKILHVTDSGEADEYYDAEVIEIENKKYAKFVTTHFSTYAVVAENEETKTNPKTSDNIIYYLGLLISSAFLLKYFKK